MDNLPKNTNLIPPNPQIEVNSLRPFTQFCLSIGAIPSSYKMALTYEEQLLWLCDFLENTVIPTVNQNGLAVTELQELYVELKNYVDNYFNNLDVQEEINNKLDEMAENGDLWHILEPYINEFLEDTQNNINQQNQKIAVLEGRMNEFSSLPNGSTSGDAELQDIRVAFNGTTYPNAGDSVRAQCLFLQNEINETSESFLSLYKNVGEWISDSLINANGYLINSEGFKRTNLIKIEDLKNIVIKGSVFYGSNLNYTKLVNFFKYNEISNTSFISSYNPKNPTPSTIVNFENFVIDIPENAKYVAFSMINYSQNTNIQVFQKYLDFDKIENNSLPENKIENMIYGENLIENLENKVLNNEGNTNASSIYKLSNFIGVEPEQILYRKNSNDIALIGCYDQNKNWISRQSIGKEVDNFSVPSNVYYIKLNDSNEDMENQVFGKYKVYEFIPFGSKLNMHVDNSLIANAILEKCSIKKLKGKNVLLMGDSIAYGVGATDISKSWAKIFEEKSGCNLTNIAVSGSSIQYRANVDNEVPSLYTLSTTTDFSNYDYVIISAGTNDILGNIGTYESQENTTACGALNLVIQNILTSNPYCKIIYFTPMFRNRFTQGDGHNSDDYAWQNKWVIDLADNLQQTSERNHVPCKNLYRDFMLNKYNANILLSDGLHPNDLGYERLANCIIDFITCNT